MRRALIGFLLLACATLAAAQAPLPIPQPSAHVVDQTATLSAEQRARLETRLTAFERERGAQIAVLLVASTAPESVEQYALRVAEAWRLGRQGVDDGALLLVAKNDRKLRIEVGYGLEGALPDAVAKRIVSETIAPRFSGGDFYGGIEAGIEAMLRVVGGEDLPPPRSAPRQRAGAGVDLETLAFAGFALVFVVGGVLRAIFGRLLAAGIIGGIAGFAVAVVLSSLLLGIVAAIVAFVVALFAGIGGGRGWGGGAPWGGGGGGFSGGGGRFGGGGASGGW